jgi:hypothetical protein
MASRVFSFVREALVKWVVSILLSLVFSVSVAASGDAPVHDRYIATAHCITASFPRGVPVSAVMRNDEDAIDAALQRIEDFGMQCDRIAVEVVYLP